VEALASPAVRTSAAVAALARREDRLVRAEGGETSVRILGSTGASAAASRDPWTPPRDQTRLGDGARRITPTRTVSGTASRRPD